MDATAAQALIRFGLGRKGAETPPSDPHAALRAELVAPDPLRFPDAPDSAAALTALRADRADRLAAKGDPAKPGPGRARALYREDALTTLNAAIDTPAPFRERLVWFWANHFTVSLRHGGVAPLAGPYMREAIRPHVTGRFADMLRAVMQHPAMLIYLDNVGSVGPDSEAGRRGHRGLNENLARECLELHTLGRDAGYTQADVTAFAALLTGWSVGREAETPGFLFRPRAHEPGTQTLMGRVFPEGEAGGVAALDFLAAHPATQHRLARKLVAHFVADDPPPDPVRRIACVLRDSGGDLGAAGQALIDLQGAWQPLVKLRTPQDHVIAVLRALDVPAAERPDLPTLLGGLGQPLWGAPLPDGWPDRAADWAAPDLLLRRIDWLYGFTGRVQDADPAALAEASLGLLLRPETRTALAHAGSRRDALTLLFAAPEFLRR